MPIRRLNKLTAREVAGAQNGSHSDGCGLYLKARRSWVFRFTRNGKTSERGLGHANSTVTLAKAREEASDYARWSTRAKTPLADRRRVAARDAWAASSLASWERSLFRDAKRLADLEVVIWAEAVTSRHAELCPASRLCSTAPSRMAGDR